MNITPTASAKESFGSSGHQKEEEVKFTVSEASEAKVARLFEARSTLRKMKQKVFFF